MADGGVSQGNEFAAYVARHLPCIEAAVRAHAPHVSREQTSCDEAPHEQTSGTQADLERYLYGPVQGFVASGGKRIRPALCLLGAEAVGAAPETALAAAASVELFQAAALIHDDIADKSELRRGKPCLHISEGVGLAINAGDAALVSTISAICRNQKMPAGMRLRVLDEIVSMEERTLEGQALDLGWARDGRWDVSVDDYLLMASHKTAYYSAAVPLALGAICGSGSDEQVQGLRRFGMDCGLAFQIQDDLLNLVGDAGLQGKDYRSDITEGKRTLVMVWALEHLDQARREELVGILSSGTTNARVLDRAVGLAREAAALEHARSYACTLVDHAKETLDGIDIARAPRRVLRSMADFFVERNS